MLKSTQTKKRSGKNVLFILCTVLAIAASSGTGVSAKQKEINKQEAKVLYYDEISGVKIINNNNFLLKVQKNKRGLLIVNELGLYPDAYPKGLPAPGTHIDPLPE